MALHFAYGSNMSRTLMAVRCPTARALGTATLRHWGFVIGIGGHGSLARAPGKIVHGVLWRLAPRDLAAINAYEGIDTGYYLRRIVPVRQGPRLVPALVYILRQDGRGRPRPTYINLVTAAAREWGLPRRYIDSLRRWSPSRWTGTRASDTGEIG